MKVFCEVDRVLRPLKQAALQRHYHQFKQRALLVLWRQHKYEWCVALYASIHVLLWMRLSVHAICLICLGKLHVQRRCVTYMEYRPTYNYLVPHWTTCTAHLQVMHVSLRAQYHCTSTMLLLLSFIQALFCCPSLDTEDHTYLMRTISSFVLRFLALISYLCLIAYCLVSRIWSIITRFLGFESFCLIFKSHQFNLYLVTTSHHNHQSFLIIIVSTDSTKCVKWKTQLLWVDSLVQHFCCIIWLVNERSYLAPNFVWNN